MGCGGLSAVLSEGRVDALALSRGFSGRYRRLCFMRRSSGRADDRGSHATTRVQSAPRVMLNWQAVPFTCVKEDKKWIREKNGRRVLRSSVGGGKTKYWRAPRPRPSLHRRRRRGGKRAVLNTAPAQDPTSPTSLLQPQVAIQVLQSLIRDAHQRNAELQLELQEEKKKQQKSQQKLSELQAAHSALQEKTSQGQARMPVNQQSELRQEESEVRHRTQMQMQNPQRIENDAELVQHFACLIGMFCFGYYCHYTFSKLVP